MEHFPELFNESYTEYPLLDFSCGDASEIVTSNITQYDFGDAYRVKVLDDEGRPVFTGKVDFYVNHELAGTSLVDYSGVASLDLSSCISVNGTYDIVSYYSRDDDSNLILARQSVVVKHLDMNDRDIQVILEGVKLYDLGEYYSVKVVDKAGRPVTDGNVFFIVYDRVYYSNLSDEGIASCVLPLDLNFTGNLVVWSIYSDGDLYDLAVSEQISIGTRTLIALDTTSLGSRMDIRWSGRDFVYDDGKYLAYLGNGGYLVIELSGKTYLLHNLTLKTDMDFNMIFHSFHDVINQDDVVVINLVNRTYHMDEYSFSDQEWDYVSRFDFGQLIVNGNGAVLEGNRDLNFMFIGSDANVNFFDVNITNFDHCFINHGSLMCKDCVFYDNLAYTNGVKLWGSGTVVHNYNTVFFDDCVFVDNDAEFNGFTKDHIDASILYAEPYSLNIFDGLVGTMYSDSFYCEEFSTTIVYNNDYEVISRLLKDSEIDINAYFAVVDPIVFNVDEPWVVNVSNVQELGAVFWVLNSFINASEVVINLAPGEYIFDADDYSGIMYFNWWHKAYDELVMENRYLLDVGFCPVTINGNGAVIGVKGNGGQNDCHFAFVGKYGSLTLNDVELRDFNTALHVTGGFFANHTVFRHNFLDYRYYNDNDGGAFRAFGGSVVCHDCSFIDNGVGNDATIYIADFYAGNGSYVELRNCSSPVGIVDDSYLKSSLVDKKNVNLKDGSVFEDAFELGFEDVDFVIFNVSDDASYGAVFDYLKNHTVACLYINFTGDYVFGFSDVFERRMSVVFVNNGFDVRFDEMEIDKSSSFTFINFAFDDVKIVNKGSASFINCSFFNRVGDDYFLKNEGSCSLVNCSFFNNYCDDEIIYNEGTLTIYDTVFRNSTYDGDDYGIIHNDGGSVSCVNTEFGETDGGTHVYNFNTGNCGFASTGYHYNNAEFDKPWSNFKTGLIKGAFLLCTAVVSWGAGSIVGVLAPTVAGMIAATVVGAGIGFGSGLAYGLMEGNAYHDYSNLWSNVLSFTMVGLGMSQTGFSVYSAFTKKITEALNNNPDFGVAGNPQGYPGSQGAGNPQGYPGSQGAAGSHGSGEISLNDGYQNSAFREVMDHGIEDLLFNLKPVQNYYPQVYGYYADTYAAMAANPQITILDMINFYNSLYTAMAAVQMLFSAPNQQANQPATQPAKPSGGGLVNQIGVQFIKPFQIVNRMGNGGSYPEGSFVVAGAHYANPFVGIDPAVAGALVRNPLNMSDYMENFIRNNTYLSYLLNYLSYNTLISAGFNISHTNRALVLLHNFAILYEQAYLAGRYFMSSDLHYSLHFYRQSLGSFGVLLLLMLCLILIVVLLRLGSIFIGWL